MSNAHSKNSRAKVAIVTMSCCPACHFQIQMTWQHDMPELIDYKQLGLAMSFVTFIFGKSIYAKLKKCDFRKCEFLFFHIGGMKRQHDMAYMSCPRFPSNIHQKGDCI